jgi:hypothetical protein
LPVPTESGRRQEIPATGSGLVRVFVPASCKPEELPGAVLVFGGLTGQKIIRNVRIPLAEQKIGMYHSGGEAP